MALLKTSQSPPCSASHRDESAFRLCTNRSRSQRRVTARRLLYVERTAVPRADAGGGAPLSGSPKPRQLDRAAAALARSVEDVEDTVHGAVAGLGAVAVAGAAGLELLSFHARYQGQAQRSQTAVALQRQLQELRNEQAAVESQGRRGARELEGLQRRQVMIAVDAAAAAAAPQPLGAAQSWSFWALCLALLCQLLLSALQNWGRSRTPAEVAGPAATARIAALGTLHARQSEAMRAVQHQLDKIQIRVRVLSRDLRSGVRQVQQESQQHAAALAALATGAEAAEQQMQDTQRLMQAMQVVSSKQFAVLLQALPHLKAPPTGKAPAVPEVDIAEPAPSGNPPLRNSISEQKGSAISSPAARVL